MSEPLLFLDVDGPLNPWKAKATQRPVGYKTIRARPDGTVWSDPKRPALRVWLNETHGIELQKLPYELVWATVWMHEANVWIGPHISLPELPVVKFGSFAYRKRTHWKLPKLISYANGRPFVWVDDECTEGDQEYLDRNNVSGTIFSVDPSVGLTGDDFRKLAERLEN